jgi:two-component system sensor histidine kinase UhpB
MNKPFEAGCTLGCSAYPDAERRRGGGPARPFNKAEIPITDEPQFRPWRLILLMSFSIFIAEAGIRLLFHLVPPLPHVLEPVLDAGFLLLLLSPIFYFIYFRPLVAQYRDHKEILERLTLSEERLTLALDAVEDGLWDWDLPRGELYASDRAFRMLGYEPGELGSRIEAWGKLVHPAEHATVEKMIQAHLKGTTDHYSVEHRLRRKDGSYLWLLARGQLVARSADGWPLRMVGTFKDISLRKEVETALRRREEDIRSLSRKLMQNSEEDKKHLAQDLHDEFGQVLCAFQLGVEMLRDNAEGSRDQHTAQCERLLLLIQRLETDLRHMCDHLRPVLLEDLGLVEALNWLVEQFGNQHPAVKIEFRRDSEAFCLSADQEIALYRICQEALNNIGKHAAASRVELALQRQAAGLTLGISDNGQGFDEDKIVHHRGGWGLGLLGMRERAAVVGAEMSLTSAIGGGTSINVVLPLNRGSRDPVVAHQVEEGRV